MIYLYPKISPLSAVFFSFFQFFVVLKKPNDFNDVKKALFYKEILLLQIQVEKDPFLLFSFSAWRKRILFYFCHF